MKRGEGKVLMSCLAVVVGTIEPRSLQCQYGARQVRICQTGVGWRRGEGGGGRGAGPEGGGEGTEEWQEWACGVSESLGLGWG